MAPQTNPWHILGSKPGMPLADVEKNYRVLLALWESTGKTDNADIVEGAWLVVSNPMLRAAYDVSVGDAAAPPESSSVPPPLQADSSQKPKSSLWPGGTPHISYPAGPTPANVIPLSALPPHLRVGTASSSRNITPADNPPQPPRQVDKTSQRQAPIPQVPKGDVPSAQPATQVPASAPPGQDLARAKSARIYILGMRPNQVKYAEEMTKIQKSLDALHQEIFDIHFVESFPPQNDGHHYFSRSNFAGLGPQARSTHEADMVQRRLLEQTKEAEIAKFQEAYQKSLDDLVALNKRVLPAKLYLGELGVGAEFQAVESAFEAWLAEFALRTEARRKGGHELRDELAKVREAQIQQDEADARATAEFEENAARVIQGDAHHPSLDTIMALHPNGYGRERFDRAGRVGPTGRKFTAEEQAYEDRVDAESIGGDSSSIGGRGRGGGRGGGSRGGGGRGGFGGRGGGRGGIGAGAPSRPMAAEDLAYEERLALLDKDMDSLFGPRTPLDRGRRGH